MNLFRNSLFSAVTLGHFTIDLFNSSGPVLVTFLSIPMGLTAAQIGIAIGAYQFFSALTQPLFGWIDDRIGSRWLGPGSVAWTIGFLILSLVIAGQTGSFLLFMIPFVLASMGSSAFHPLGTKHASEASIRQTATGTALFFLFGQVGLASGPVLAGVILDTIGIGGIYLMAFLASPMILFMAFAMRHTHPDLTVPLPDAGPDIDRKTAVRWGTIALLALLIGLRSWSTIGTVTFLPKMFQDMGWSPSAYGSITGAFWMASAIAGVVAGHLADRWGRRQVIFATLLAGSLTLYFLPLYDNWLAFVLAILTGGLFGASHSILVIISQALLPGRKSFTSGVTLGYLFGVGAIAAWGIGWLADIWSLSLVVQAGAATSIIAALLALVLPSTKKRVESQPESSRVAA
jgi:FSR family fosmidomycin resistance protein-like MFS transporter